ncbi:MAG: HPr family phosphocarrier protein [Oscillospiraceae bacterium]|nr:HPr family phosphocarrier protein [Oscillospiraceae bacterium]
MFTVEKHSVIAVDWSSRYVNSMIEILTAKADSNIYIAKEKSRQVAMKSLIGLLSGNFKEGDEVKITVIGDNEERANRDMLIAEGMLRGEI